MPANIEDMTVMRAVIRNGVSMDFINLLIEDMRNDVAFLDGLSGSTLKEAKTTAVFHH